MTSAEQKYSFTDLCGLERSTRPLSNHLYMNVGMTYAYRRPWPLCYFAIIKKRWEWEGLYYTFELIGKMGILTCCIRARLARFKNLGCLYIFQNIGRIDMWTVQKLGVQSTCFCYQNVTLRADPQFWILSAAVFEILGSLIRSPLDSIAVRRSSFL